MTDKETSGPAARPFGPAFALAIRGRCPACGKGRMFARYLQPVQSCDHCGQRWDVHQADDFPAYIVILLLGHILVPLMIEVNASLAIPLGWQAVIWPGLALILCVLLIQPVKGAVIAFQWSRRMHGFT
ncbi:DUF983 domain-containing protein [Sphingobium cloacae]|uniref:Zinc-finger protein n=1 Tax=Sphingobium cloacae TaxID=120107 RepID=A0A1E1F7D0_9SPHN|nr:DUF983 domain-containing protein [Sphingobium cloacae]BAV66321.1 hypothetical protein SCLO_1032810 [Sphingobium cloacae]